jgi:hypothetical protein
VEQSVDAIKVEECAEVGDVLDGTLDLVTGADGSKELLASLATGGLDEFPAAEDDVLAILVEFHDLEVVGVAHELLEILGGIDIDLGGGEESLHSDVDHEAALHDGFDTSLDDALCLEKFDDLLPVLALGCFLL